RPPRLSLTPKGHPPPHRDYLLNRIEVAPLPDSPIPNPGRVVLGLYWRGSMTRRLNRHALRRIEMPGLRRIRKIRKVIFVRRSAKWSPTGRIRSKLVRLRLRQ